MSDKTGIEWTDATWSPIAAFRRDNGKRGWHCEKVSEGCRGCYAEKLNGRNLQSGTGLPYTRASRDLVEIHTVNLDVPLRWRRPRRIFVESMSDLFADFVPDELIDSVFAVMAVGASDIVHCRARGCDHEPCSEGLPTFARHTFQVLTKRPERMRRYISAPGVQDRISEALDDLGWAWSSDAAEQLCETWPLPNVWLGVSVEDQATADARVPLLLQTPAAVRFVSYEPALGPVDWLADELIAKRLPPENCACHIAPPCSACVEPGLEPLLDWVIVGGESGPGARPCDVAWIRSTRDQCRAAGVACFVKQLGALPIKGMESLGSRAAAAWIAGVEIPLRDRKGGDMAEWPEDLRVREFPAVAHG